MLSQMGEQVKLEASWSIGKQNQELENLALENLIDMKT